MIVTGEVIVPMTNLSDTPVVTMVLIFDGNSEHFARALRKINLYRENFLVLMKSLITNISQYVRTTSELPYNLSTMSITERSIKNCFLAIN